MSTAAPLPVSATEPGSLPAVEQLPDDLATLKQMIRELLATLRQERHDKESLRHRLDLLLRRLYGPRGERFDPSQLLLFDAPAENPVPEPAAEAAQPEPAKRRARPHGRRRLPANLPREPLHHQLPLAERLCPGCGHECRDIGSDRSEQLEYRPASLFVVEHFVHKYACPQCGKAAEISIPEPVATAAAAEATVIVVSPTEGQPSAEGPVSDPTAHDAHQAEAARPPATSLVPSPEPDPVSSHPDQPAAEPPARESEPPVTADRQPGAAGVVLSAAKPEMPIAKGLPGPGLLAHLIVSKFVDHLPLYRLERIYERQGVFLPRSTTCDWLAACARLLKPLVDRMIALVLQSRVIHTDDTPVTIHDPPPGATDTGRMWAYLGDRDHPLNVFAFTPNRKRDGPQTFLKTYQGYLQADAFSGYDGLYLPDPVAGVARIHEVACNAHARRKFYEARTSDALRAHQALAYYGQLYDLERGAAKLAFDDTQRLAMRQDLAVPILCQFKTWLEGERADVLPKSPMGEAVGYALRNWEALIRYTEAGFLAIDNNVAEREMKRIAIGRKNWLFVGSLAGGQTAAVLMSVTSTCNRLGVEPWAYLQDVLTRLPTTPPADLDALLPHSWQAARQAAAVPTDPPS